MTSLQADKHGCGDYKFFNNCLFGIICSFLVLTEKEKKFEEIKEEKKIISSLIINDELMKNGSSL